MFGILNEKRIKYFRGFFDDTHNNEEKKLAQKRKSTLLPEGYTSFDSYGEAYKIQEGRGMKKKTVFIHKNHLFYFSKILGMITYVKSVDLSEVYAVYDQDDDLIKQKGENPCWNIILFKNSKYLKFTFKDWRVFAKFRSTLTKSSFLINFVHKYSFLGFLKSGGFAEVSTVENKFTHLTYAAKMFYLEDRQSDKTQKSFNQALLKNEIYILRHLRSDYICNLEEIYELNDKVIFIMEHLQQDLGCYFKNFGQTMNTKTIKNIIKQVLRALEFIHEKGVIHRDVKPDNIMITKDDKKLKLIDFGLSTWADMEDNFRYQKCGTLQYMAPEVKEDKLYDSKVDIYSLGVTFYLLLTGKINTVLNEEELAIIDKLSYSIPDSISSSLSPLGLDLLQKMVRKDPYLRLSAKEALQHEWFAKKVKFSKGNDSNFKTEVDINQNESSPLENINKFKQMCSSLNAFDLKGKKPFEKIDLDSTNPVIKNYISGKYLTTVL